MRARDKIEVLLNDENLVAVLKPAGLATIPGRDSDDCVIARLAEQLKLPFTGSADPRLRVVHRLDKDTSGVLLFAKDATTQRFICEQFRQNEVRKEYLALTVGRARDDAGTIDAQLAPHLKSKLRMAVVKHGGKRSITEWKVEERYREFTLIRCFPRTGRTHQIRVHLALIGSRLAIDPLYNTPPAGGSGAIYLSHFKRDYRPTRGKVEYPLIERLTLHAEKLTFKHPNGETLTLETLMPKDMRAVCSQLRKNR